VNLIPGLKVAPRVLVPLTALLVAVGAGCANQKKNTAVAANPSVTDINPQQAGPSREMAFQPAYPTGPSGTGYPAAGTFEPVPPGPAVTQTPAVTTTPTAPTAASNGNSYTVQKGDTLYGIARQRYGDGKQWQKIASANPGVSPSSLKVGQTILIP
jgi:5'-nucleotidase